MYILEENQEFFHVDLDEQNCELRFGSWTYNQHQLNFTYYDEKERNVTIKDYVVSGSWDLMAGPMSIQHPTNESHMLYERSYRHDRVEFVCKLIIRRKTLFYTVNLIIPCVGISFLTVLTFYLPSDSGEKVALCISILLSLTVFFLLLAELIPPTSLVVPLIGKYLLFTMILVTLSIVVTVVVLNIHFRSPLTHQMPPWVRRVFLHVLPKLLWMRRPKSIDPVHYHISSVQQTRLKSSNRSRTTTTNNFTVPLFSSSPYQIRKTKNCLLDDYEFEYDETPNRPTSSEYSTEPSLYPQEIRKAFDGLKRIATHMRQEDEEKKIKEEWKYVALVIDRLFLYVFTTACIAGTCGIILQGNERRKLKIYLFLSFLLAPSIYDSATPIDKEKSNRF